jgi:hypothetical protein
MSNNKFNRMPIQSIVVFLCLLILSPVTAAGCTQKQTTGPTIAAITNPSFSSSVSRVNFEDRNIYTSYPTSVTYLPVQLDSFSGTTYPGGLARGQLVLEGGVFRLKPIRLLDTGEYPLLVWPPGFSARTVSGATYITDKNGNVAAFVGDVIELGGGEVPASIVEKYTGQPVPADYPAPFWLVSNIVSDNNSLAKSLPDAKPYAIYCEGNLANDIKSRTSGLWFITSDQASNSEEWAQTAIVAVSDLHRICGRILTGVSLVVSNEVWRVDYAQAIYAADGKGALGMTGSAPSESLFWRVSAADRQLTEQEKSIAKLWIEKERDFPQTDMLSSLSYDAIALKKHIAETLGIPIDEVDEINLQLTDYPCDHRF